MTTSCGIDDIDRTAARYNRGLPRDGGIVTVMFIGSAECGKSSLIDTSIARLRSEFRIRVITCGATDRDEVPLVDRGPLLLGQPEPSVLDLDGEAPAHLLAPDRDLAARRGEHGVLRVR